MDNKELEVIATLQVVMRRGNKGGSSAMGKVDPSHFFLVLRPDEDKTINDNDMESKHLLENVLAHELGHFVSSLLHDPTSSEKLQAAYGYTIVDEERRAWELAEKMTPVDTNLRDKVLKDYAAEADREMAARTAPIFRDEEDNGNPLAALEELLSHHPNQ